MARAAGSHRRLPDRLLPAPARTASPSRQRAGAIVAIAAALLALYLAVRHLWPAVATVLGGGALHYLFAPVVRALARRRVPRLLSAVTLLLGLTGSVAYAIASVVPRLYGELRNLLVELPDRIAVARSWFDERGLGPLTGGLFDRAAADTHAALAPGAIVSGLMTAFGSFSTVALALIFATYLLAGGDDLARGAARWIPPASRRRWVLFAVDSSRLLAGYVRARVLASTFVAFSYWLAFLVIGVPHALLLGVAGGILNFVPLVGPLLAAVPAVFVAAFRGWPTVVAVVAVMFVAQQIEGGVIGPLVEGRFVRLPPPLIVVVVAVGGALLGIPGMVVAVPIAAVTKRALQVFYRGTWEPPRRAERDRRPDRERRATERDAGALSSPAREVRA